MKTEFIIQFHVSNLLKYWVVGIDIPSVIFYLHRKDILLFIPGLSRRFGTLPYLPFAWFVYSMFLVFKVGIIFTTYVTFFRTTDDNFKVENFQNQSTSNCSFGGNTTGQSIYNEESVLELGPNLLKIAVGSTALVFIIILQMHILNRELYN